MKATGIIRRIDELGRIVIPKEIRKNLKLKDGENLEIYIDDHENIILKRHSTLKKFNEISKIIVEALSVMLGETVIITDINEIVYSSKKEINNKQLSDQYISLINNRIKIENNKELLNITNDIIVDKYLLAPIILNGDLLGSCIIILKENIDLKQKNLIDLGIKILLKYIDE